MSETELNKAVDGMLAVATEQLAISDVTLERVLSTLSDTVLNDILLKGDTIKEFFDRAKAEATRRAIYNKTQFTGFKLRNGSERRFFVNEEAVADILEQHGVNPWQPKKLRTLSSIEKEIGTTAFKELEPYVMTEETAPTLVAVKARKETY